MSTLVTEYSEKAVLVKDLEYMTYIQYPIIISFGLIFNNLMPAFFDSNNKVNTIHSTFAKIRSYNMIYKD